MPLSWIFWLLAAFSANHMAVAQAAPEIKTDATLASKPTLAYPIDINHADLKNLTHLKGIGQKRAAAIIRYRQQHGIFHSVNDLVQVKGFTPKRVQTLLSTNQGKITTLH
jgi:competence protein ComEA